MDYFERNYNIARSLGSRRSLDLARIQLGVARGDKMFERFVDVADMDLPKLLAWKSTRSGLDTDD